MMNQPRIGGPFAAVMFLTVTAVSAEEVPFETTVADVARAPLERVHDGTVEAVNKATMSAQTSGRIAELFYDVDDYVEPGDPIVRFTDVEQQASLQQAKANLEAALARQQQAVAEFRRAEREALRLHPVG